MAQAGFWELEEFIDQGSALIGSPQQVLDKINAHRAVPTSAHRSQR